MDVRIYGIMLSVMTYALIILLVVGFFSVVVRHPFFHPQAGFPFLLSRNRVRQLNKHTFQYMKDGAHATLSLRNVKIVDYDRRTWWGIGLGIPATYDLRLHVDDTQTSVTFLNFSKKAFRSVSETCSELGIDMVENQHVEPTILFMRIFRV